MKKILFGLIATVFLGMFSAQAQEEKASQRVKLFCYTTSCCSFGFFDIEIISTKHCHYISYQRNGAQDDKYSVKFNSKENLEEVEIVQDVVMPQFSNSEDEPIILEKGKYALTNNEFIYTPKANAKIHKICHEEHVTGHILGYEVDYTVKICAYYIWFRTSGKGGSLKITPELTREQKELVTKNDNKVSFSKDIEVKNSEFSYTIKAGNYDLNEDGSIYILNVENQ